MKVPLIITFGLIALGLLPDDDGGGEQATAPSLPAGRYFDNLQDIQRAGIAMTIKQLRNHGVTNPYTIAATLAVLSKESGFKPRSEQGYGKASNTRIRNIFGSRVSHLSDSELDRLKADDEDFFNLVYKHLGGYRYRGRGLIQLTGIEDGDKDLEGYEEGIAGIENYRAYGREIGIDLVSDPDQANRIGPAAEITAVYVKRSLERAPDSRKKLYGFTGPNDLKDLATATNAVYHAVAGWGKSLEAIQRDPAGGLKLSRQRAPLFLAIVQKSN